MIDQRSEKTAYQHQIGAIIGVLCLYLGFMFQMYADPILWPVMGSELHIGNSYVLALTISGLFAAVATPIAAKCNTLYPAKTILVISALGAFFCYPLQGFAHQTAVLLTLRGFGGIATSFLYTTTLKIIGDLFPPEQRGFWIGIQGALMGLSGIIVPPAAGALIDHGMITAVFFFPAPLYLGGILCLKGIPAAKEKTRTAPPIPWKSAVFVTLALGSFLLLTAQGDIRFAAPIPFLLILCCIVTAVIAFLCEKQAGNNALIPFAVCKDRNFLLITAASFTSAASAAFFYYGFAYYMLTYMNASATETGIAIGLQFLITLFLAPFYGKHIDKKKVFRESLIVSTMVMVAIYVGFALFLKAETPLLFVNLGMLLFGVYTMVISVIYPFAAQNLVTEEQRSYAVGGYKLATSLGYSVPLALFTVILNFCGNRIEYGYDILYLISIVLTILTLILTMKIRCKA